MCEDATARLSRCDQDHHPHYALRIDAAHLSTPALYDLRCQPVQLKVQSHLIQMIQRVIAWVSSPNLYRDKLMSLTINPSFPRQALGECQRSREDDH